MGCIDLKAGIHLGIRPQLLLGNPIQEINRAPVKEAPAPCDLIWSVILMKRYGPASREKTQPATEPRDVGLVKKEKRAGTPN